MWEDSKIMNKLEKIFEEAIKEPGKRIEFYKTLLEEKVYAIIPIDSDEDIKDGKYVKDNKVRLLTLKNQNEIEFFPVFTSVEEIRKAFPKHNVGYVEGPGRWYFNLVRGKNVILNPFSENAKPFVPQEIEDMLSGNLFDVKKTAINKDQQIMIGKPKVYPEKLVNTLKSYFEGNKDVRTAFLVEYSNGEDRPHSLVIVDTEGDMESLVREASIAAKGSLEDGNYVEFMELDLSNTIGVHVINSETPFYKREN